MNTTHHKTFLLGYAAILIALLIAGFASAQVSTQPTSRNAADWPDSPEHRRILEAAEKSVAEAAAAVVKDRFRPGYHFLPAGRFMNDPNGCVQVDGVYHMFFQHLPFWPRKDAPLAPGWGHAVSRDLVHWERWPIALMPMPGTYDAAAVASGCCVVANGAPTIIYTSVPPQAQSLARSFDGMKTWQRYKQNPVIPKPPAVENLDEGFRDPCVWREGERWRMLVGSGIRGVGGTVLLYESPDLISWTFLSQLCTGMGADCFQWECPNFFPLGDRWVLIVSPLYRSIPALRGPVQYTVGKYDGRTFEHGEWHPLDLGGPTVFYAPNNLRDDRGRRILWGWLMGGGEPGSPWDGILTLPRVLELGTDNRLRVGPAKEVNSLRTEKLADIGQRTLKAGETLDIARGVQTDLTIELSPQNSGRLCIDVLRNETDGKATTIRFDLASSELRCGDKAGVVTHRSDDARTLRVLIDRSVIEVYADRREVMSLRAYLPAGADGIRLVAENSPVQLQRVQAWRMAEIW